MWPFSRINALVHEMIRQESRALTAESRSSRAEDRIEQLRELSECPPDCDLETWIKTLVASHKSLPDPIKLRALADWLDLEQDSGRWGGPEGAHEVQDDLRKWADTAEPKGEPDE